MTLLPAPVRESVESALTTIAGRPDAVETTSPVSGGCIHNGTRLETSSGATFFLKWNADAPPGIFAAEAGGLRALRRAVHAIHEADPKTPATGTTLIVPEPLAWSDAPVGWLLMEYVEPTPPAPDSWERLGHGLAAMHGTAGGAAFGWPESNWIGSLSQDNAPSPDWATFWRARRIAPQLALARKKGGLTEAVFDRLLESIPAAVQDAGPPSLLHGDLWSGNTFTTGRGVPVLVDPAAYAGDGEVDLAMTELFGGFAPGFYDAYDEARPISAAYRSHRRDLYQLYYLLVHVNLFGGSYATAAKAAAERVVAAVR